MKRYTEAPRTVYVPSGEAGPMTRQMVYSSLAVAPVTRWELYDTAYTERYLGDPRQQQAAYDAADVIADAPKIVDPLLVMHGMADDNVFFDNTVALVSKLEDAKVPFEMIVYPGKTHAISGISAQTHVYGTMERFLDEKLRSKQ